MTLKDKLLKRIDSVIDEKPLSINNFLPSSDSFNAIQDAFSNKFYISNIILIILILYLIVKIACLIIYIVYEYNNSLEIDIVSEELVNKIKDSLDQDIIDKIFDKETYKLKDNYYEIIKNNIKNRPEAEQAKILITHKLIANNEAKFKESGKEIINFISDESNDFIKLILEDVNSFEELLIDFDIDLDINVDVNNVKKVIDDITLGLENVQSSFSNFLKLIQKQQYPINIIIDSALFFIILIIIILSLIYYKLKWILLIAGIVLVLLYSFIYKDNILLNLIGICLIYYFILTLFYKQIKDIIRK